MDDLEFRGILLIVGILLIGVFVFSVSPIISEESRIIFTVSDKLDRAQINGHEHSEGRYEVLTSDGKTLLFTTEEDETIVQKVSDVQMQHMWNVLKIGKSYMCYTQSLTSLAYGHQQFIYNCREV